MENNIQKLIIDGFKGFTEEVEISFSNLTVFAGGNSVGKSTIIQALLVS
ncbi:MAG: AAA family ATPase, partial [Saprospiraceae bacterium]